jgi:drug/metabolite transporter (DMT)-like permease
MLLALVCALAANLCYGFGTVLQATGARRASTAGHLDVMLFARLSRQVPYLGGLALDALGFVASLIALRTLPLFVVQAAIAGSVGVTAMTGVFVLGCRLRPSDTSAIVVLVVGLGLLGASARGQHAAHLSHLGGWLLLIGVFVVASAGIIAARIPDPRGAIGLAACAGLGFTGTAVAARALHVPAESWRVALEPVAIALVLYGVCGMLMFAVETIVPSIVGLTALGDRTRPHFEIVAALGFSLTVGASIALARYTETIVLIEPASEQAT